MGKTEQERPSLWRRMYGPLVRSAKENKVLRGAGFAVLAALIFMFGVGVGNGRLVIGGTAAGSENGNLPANLNYAATDQVYDLLKAKYDGKLDVAKLQDGLKEGLAQATGDPYTEYFSASEAKAFENQLKGISFSGVGAELGKDDGGNLIVVSAIKDAPADRAGVRSKDIIAAIDGASTSGMQIDDAVSKIRGKKGTDVTLKLVRNKSDELTVKITRDDIKTPSVNSTILDGNIGYLQITQFSDDTISLATQAANDFRSKQVKGVILDLRDDPGGELDAAVGVSSLWLPSNKKVLDEKRGSTVVQTHYSNGNALLEGVPTAVLINGGSASASEITAGALKDNGAATLYGEKSYGKGSVQEIMPLPGGAEIKITIARWYRPNGQNIDKKGITPDKQVSISDDDLANNRDPQKDAALAALRQ